MPTLFVVKLNGEEELFSLKKIYNSARRVGASKLLAERIGRAIEKKAYPGIKTSTIFKLVLKMMKQNEPNVALKFNLRAAIGKLGPTGFPFEKYIGEIFKKKGFKVKTNQYVMGRCIRYEIDFLAQKGSLLYIGECKYRNLSCGKVGSIDALVNYARFLDIKKGSMSSKRLKLKSILVTNAKFTSRAIRYSNCVGVELLGWRHPKGKGLEGLIEDKKLYPITVLPSLSPKMAEVFAAKKIMMISDLLKENKGLKIPNTELAKLRREAEILLK